jgi:hypothetical protein
MRVAVQSAAFFELCPDEVLDPDLALKQLEWIASELHRLDSDARDELVAFVQEEARATDDRRYRTFLLEFPQSFGLRDEA